MTYGRGEDGQLGHGRADNENKPLVVEALYGKEIDFVACGAEYTMAISSKRNEVWSWGWGDFGRLGHGDGNDLFIPKQIASFAGVPIKLVACGDCHTMVVSTVGDVFSFGRNQNGQLGSGCQLDSMIPQKITSLAGQKVTHVGCGAEHTVCSTAEGKVYAWGWGRYGNLGLGDCKDRDTPELVQGALAGVNIKTVACGWRHSCAVSEKGELYTFGWSKYGQLGHGDNETCEQPKKVEGLGDKVVALVSGGWRHTMVADAEGRVYGWGWNQYGQVGNGSHVDANKPVLICAGGLEKEKAKIIVCGWKHSVAITEGGDFYCWGRGVHGQLGHGDCMDSNVPRRLDCLSGTTCDISTLRSTVKVPSTLQSIPAEERYALVPENKPADVSYGLVPENPTEKPDGGGALKKQKVV